MNTNLLGWTMLHFLWLGGALLVVAAIVRLALRRAGANVRYVHSLATLLALAALPIGIATFLSGSPPPSAGEGLGEGGIATESAGGFAALRPQPPIEDTGLASSTQIIELNPEYTPPESAQPTLPPPPSAGEGLGEGGIATEPAGGFAERRPQPTTNTGKASDTLERTLAYIQTAVPYLPYLWLLGTPITFALLATGLIGAERMRRHGTLLSDGPVHEACQRLRKSLRITRKVALAVCDRVAQPVLVGVVRPLILLPPAALAGWSPEQLEMVLLHELAHVRRWDNLVNLAQRVIESLLFFHPAVWIASTWVRRDREDCCDAVVVTRTEQPKQYAELLVALASPQPLVGAALARHPLAGRLRRILKLEDEPMLVSRNTIGLLVLAVVAIALVVISGPLRVQGEGQGVELEPVASDPPPPSAGEGETEGAKEPPKPWTHVLAGIKYPSPREGDIAARAWEELGLKIAPATDADLEHARKQGYRGGLKVVGGKVNLKDLPVIMTTLQGVDIKDFSDLEQALNEIKAINPGVVEWAGMQGEQPINTSMVRERQETESKPPAPTGERANRGVSTRIYEIPVDKRDEVLDVEQWINSPNRINVQSIPGENNRVRISATEEEHERIAKVFSQLPSKLPVLSPEDQMIVQRAFDMFGIVIGPPSDEELQLARTHGVHGGLKFLSGPTGKVSESILLISLADRNTETFADLNKALEWIEANKPASTKSTYLICSDGKKPSTTWERDENNTPLYRAYRPNERIVKAHEIPKDLRESVTKWAETVQSIQGVWDDRGQFIMQASRSKHEELDRLVQGTEKWNDPEAPKERAKNPIVTRDENGQPVLEWRSTGLTLKGATTVEFPEASRNMIGPTGVEVVAVEPGSPAAWQDVRPGDVLTSVDRFRMENVPEAASILESFLRGFGQNRTVELRFYRAQGGIQPLLRAIRLPLRAEPVKEIGVEEDERRLEFFRRMRDQGQGTIEGRGVNSDAGVVGKIALAQAPPPIASAAELKVLREYAEVLEEQFKLIDGLARQGARGGEADKRYLAAYEMYLAQGELAIAEGDRTKAFQKFESALDAAQNAFSAATQAYKSGLVTYDFLLEAIKNKAEIGRKIAALKEGKQASAGEPATISFRGVNSDAGVRGRMVYETNADGTTVGRMIYEPVDEFGTPRVLYGGPVNDRPTTTPASAAPMTFPAPSPWAEPATNTPRWPSATEKSSASPVPSLSSPLPPSERPLGSEGRLSAALPASPPVAPSAPGPSLLEPPTGLDPTQPSTGTSPVPTLNTPDTLSETDPPSTLPPPTPSAPTIRNPNSEKSSPAGAGNAQPVYRYDGKTFQTWRDTWKHELSTEKRIEAVKALAAFGRAGYAKEAAETILDVAGEYDFTAHLADEAPEAKLRNAIVYNLAVSPYRLDESIWFPMLIKRFNEKPEQWKGLLRYILSSVQRVDKEYVEEIDGLTENSDPQLRSAALKALYAVDQAEFRKRVPAALAEADAGVIGNALNLLSRQLQIRSVRRDLVEKDPWNEFPIDEVLTLLSHPSQVIRSSARDAFIRSPEPRRHLQAILADSSRKGDHLQAVRAVGEIAQNLGSPLPELETLFDETDDPQLRVAIAVTNSRFRMPGKSKRNLMQELQDASENEEELRKMILEEQGLRRR